MIGAIFGDIVGSAYEFNNTYNYDFELLTKRSDMTDDSMMTLAVAKGLLESWGKSDNDIRESLIDSMKEVGQKYPNAGYGGRFIHWVLGDSREPINSFGNGSAMRVSAAGWLFDTLEETLHMAQLTADVTHNHPEGIKGAQATAAAMFMARNGKSKDEIRDFIENRFGYDLNKSMKDIVSKGHGEEICQITVPQALVCFLLSKSYIDCIRRSVSIGGDSDTIACIAGGIAEAYYGMDNEYKDVVFEKADSYLSSIIRSFTEKCTAYGMKVRQD